MDLETYFDLTNYLDKLVYSNDYNTAQRKQLRKQALFYFTRQGKLFQKNRKELNRPQKVITIVKIEIIIYNMYTDPLVEHFGKTKTIQRTLARYYWPTLGKDITTYIQTCDTC